MHKSLPSPLLALSSCSTSLADHTLANPSGNLGGHRTGAERAWTATFRKPCLLSCTLTKGFIAIDGCFGFLSHFLFHLHES